ncbi:MAG: acyltransferase [Saprospiraceae bacterium]|nr:acyltransferase [Saprospiraceae bacterium]
MSTFIHDTAVIDAGAKIGSGTRIWHFCHIMSGAIIGEGCSLGQNVFVADDVILGTNVKVQNNVSIYKGVICEDDVFLGPSMVFTNIINPRSEVVRRDKYETTLVRKGVSIGANATILSGIELGRYAFIGAGAVITKDVQPFAIIVGNPGIRMGWMSRYGHKLDFDRSGYATCPESSEKYELSGGEVRIIEEDE